MADEKARKESYAAAISKADASLSGKKYPQAISEYQQASSVDPSQQYPRDKITEINSILALLQSIQEAYDKKITEADNLFSGKSYQESLLAYNEALRLEPAEKYPQEKIAQLNALLDGIRATEEKYAKNIAEADGLLSDKKYAEASVVYKSALAMKPGEKYPQEKITSIEGILAELKTKDDNYSKLITEADQLFTDHKYIESISIYRQALEVKPSEKYPSGKITDAGNALAEIKAKQAEYDKNITEADKQFAAGKLQEALLSYAAASAAKPSEEYPKQKISSVNVTLAELRSRDDSYAKAIADGDAFYSEKKYLEALEPYQRATTIKKDEAYPKDQIAKINQLIAEQKKLDTRYADLLADGDKLFSSKKYDLALAAFQEASALKPAEPLPLEKINSIQKILSDQKANDEAYNKALAEADSKFASGELLPALAAYNSAAALKPGETYPKERIADIQVRIKSIDDRYSKSLAEGDAKLASRKYTEALDAYQQAIEIKPEEKYPKDQVALINETMVREKEEQEKMYTAYIAEGDKLLEGKEYVNAKSAFVKASGLKPAEQYPKDKLAEINKVLDEQARVIKEAYDKAIVDADKLYAGKVLDQAMDAYDKAGAIKPDETYPGEMVRKIKQYITDHSIKDINTETVLIAAGDERKFSFNTLEPRQKTNNYVMIRAKATGNVPPKVYFNYGRDNAKNGGIVLRSIGSKDGVDYLIRLAGQDKWYREDNNWISIYTEGSGIEISRIQISQGD